MLPGFDLVDAGPDLDDRIAEATTLLARHLDHEPLFVALSGGKDSSAVLVLALLAAQSLRAAGRQPYPIVTISGRTLVDNPMVEHLLQDALDHLRRWCDAHDVALHTEIYEPALVDSWAVNVLAGGQLPTYPGTRFRYCASKLKTSAAARCYRLLIPKIRATFGARYALEEWSVPLTLLGLRSTESASRGRRMLDRGDSAVTVTETGTGSQRRRTLSPIADWSTDDVWELLARSGTDREFRVWRPDFTDLIEFYRDSGGSCIVVPGAHQHARTACGARTGCYTCQAVGTDKSLTNMVAMAQYQHLAPLNAIRDYVASIQFRYDLRSWATRRVVQHDGRYYLVVQPDHFAPDTLRLIAGAHLTADRNERDRAAAFDRAVRAGTDPDDPYVLECRRAGHAPDDSYMQRMRRPQFQMFDPRQVVAADFTNAVLAKHERAFEFLELSHQVYELGASITVPSAPAVAPPAMLPAPRWLEIPPPDPGWLGLVDPIQSIALFDADELPQLEGMPYLGNSSSSFDVDAEAATLILALLYPDRWRQERSNPHFGPAHAVRAYLNLGAVSLSPQGVTKLQRISKMRQHLSFIGIYRMTPEMLLARSIAPLTDQAPETQLDLFGQD